MKVKHSARPTPPPFSSRSISRNGPLVKRPTRVLSTRLTGTSARRMRTPVISMLVMACPAACASPASTPGGAGIESGTKKSGASSRLGSTRYFSKSRHAVLVEQRVVDAEAAREGLGVLGQDHVRRVAHDLGRAAQRRIRASPPSRFCTAAVAMVVRGHSVLTAMPSALSSPDSPSAMMLMLNLAME